MKAGPLATIFAIIYVLISMMSAKLAFDIMEGLFDNDADFEEAIGDIIGFIVGLVIWLGFQFLSLVFIILGRMNVQRKIILLISLLSVLLNILILPSGLLYLTYDFDGSINYGSFILAIPLFIQLVVIRSGFKNK